MYYIGYILHKSTHCNYIDSIMSNLSEGDYSIVDVGNQNITLKPLTRVLVEIMSSCIPQCHSPRRKIGDEGGAS